MIVFALKPPCEANGLIVRAAKSAVQERKCSWSSGRLDTIKKKLDWMIGHNIVAGFAVAAAGVLS